MAEPPEGVLPRRARPAGEEDPLGPRLRKLGPIEEKIEMRQSAALALNY